MLELLNPVAAYGAIMGYLEAGGPVVLALMLTAFFMWMLIIERLVFFATTGGKMVSGYQQAWSERADHESWFAHAIRERLISEMRVEAERNMGIIKVLVLVTPLLGLLGTVTGMIEVFQTITSSGGANARDMAAGISRATIPTMSGLAVSLTGVFAISILDRRVSNNVEGLADSLDVHHTPKLNKGVA
jgi:biopolymer transport protein ExbB